MNKAGGFIVLHRKIMDWEWYSDANTFVLFVHLLLAANFEPGRFRGRVVERGQLITSLSSLCQATGLTMRQTRTALAHLEATGEVTNESYTQYRVITIVNYDKYQDKRQTNRQTIDKQMTNEMSTKSTGKTTSDRQQYNNNNNITNEQNNNGTRIEDDGSAPRPSAPTIEEIRTYCEKNGLTINVERFYSHYTDNGWKSKNGKPIPDWRVKAREWYQDDMRKAMEREKAPRPEKKVIAQDFPQRDYSGVPDDDMARLAADLKQFRETGEI